MGLGLILHSADDVVMMRTTEEFVGDIRLRGLQIGCWWVGSVEVAKGDTLTF